MSENWKIQVSPKLGQTLVNVRGESAEEFQANLEFAVANAQFIADAVAHLEAAYNLAAGGVSVAPAAQPVPAQPVVTHATPAAPATTTPAAQPAASAAPSCHHGPLVYREAKPGSGKSWRGYFCPSPKGTPDQCPPQFLKD